MPLANDFYYCASDLCLYQQSPSANLSQRWCSAASYYLARFRPTGEVVINRITILDPDAPGNPVYECMFPGTGVKPSSSFNPFEALAEFDAMLLTRTNQEPDPTHPLLTCPSTGIVHYLGSAKGNTRLWVSLVKAVSIDDQGKAHVLDAPVLPGAEVACDLRLNYGTVRVLRR